jgi:hypothetical protein
LSGVRPRFSSTLGCASVLLGKAPNDDAHSAFEVLFVHIFDDTVPHQTFILHDTLQEILWITLDSDEPCFGVGFGFGPIHQTAIDLWIVSPS